MSERTVRCKLCGRESKPLAWNVDDGTAKLAAEYALCPPCQAAIAAARAEGHAVGLAEAQRAVQRLGADNLVYGRPDMIALLVKANDAIAARRQQGNGDQC